MFNRSGAADRGYTLNTAIAYHNPSNLVIQD